MLIILKIITKIGFDVFNLRLGPHVTQKFSFQAIYSFVEIGLPLEPF